MRDGSFLEFDFDRSVAFGSCSFVGAFPLPHLLDALPRLVKPTFMPEILDRHPFFFPGLASFRIRTSLQGGLFRGSLFDASTSTGRRGANAAKAWSFPCTPKSPDFSLPYDSRSSSFRDEQLRGDGISRSSPFLAISVCFLLGTRGCPREMILRLIEEFYVRDDPGSHPFFPQPSPCSFLKRALEQYRKGLLSRVSDQLFGALSLNANG